MSENQSSERDPESRASDETPGEAASGEDGGRAVDEVAHDATDEVAADRAATDDLYVVYWVDEQGYGGSCEFVHASSTAAAREQSSYASGGVAHQRLLFEGSFESFRAYVEEELSDVDRFDLVWD